MSNLTTSAAGRAMIERFEGCRLDAYPDPISGGDPWTIGYGFTGVMSDGTQIVSGVTITQEQADSEMSAWLSKRWEPSLNRMITNSATTQNQFDAMISLAWNIGLGAFGNSTVLRDHNAGNYTGAAAAFSMWDKAAGVRVAALVNRRLEESKLYMGDSPAENAPIAPATDPVSQAVSALQILVGVTADGRMGPETYRATLLRQEP